MVTPSPRVMIGGVMPGPCRAKCSHRLSVILPASVALTLIARLLTRGVPALAVAGLGCRYDCSAAGQPFRRAAAASHGGRLPADRHHSGCRGHRAGGLA